MDIDLAVLPDDVKMLQQMVRSLAAERTAALAAALKDMDCSTDGEAIKQAKKLIDGHDIEIWEHGRFVAWFSSKDKRSRPR